MSLILATLAILVLVVYVGSYFALARPMAYQSLKRVGPSASSEKTAIYTFGGDMAEFVFFPANWLDRKIRYKTWQ